MKKARNSSAIQDSKETILTKSELPSLPSYVQIEPVGQCNLKCEMCAIQFREDGPPYGPPAFMPYDTFTQIIDQFETIQDLHLQGLGEPFMHPRFFEMVAYASKRGIRVTTNTNMTLLNPRRAAECIKSGLDTLHVSIDGATSHTFEGIRLKAHFDRVLSNLQLLRDTQDRLGSKLPHIKMVIVIMRRNLSELPEMVELASHFQIEEIFVQHLSHDFGESSLPAQYKPMRDFVEQETLLNEDLNTIDHFFSLAQERADLLHIHLRLPRPRPRAHLPSTPGHERCRWPWTGAYISYQGLSMPCCMVSTPDRINFGDITQNGFMSVWHNQAYQEFREKLSSDEPPEICKSCSIYKGTF
jgi:radical SAM protein with 4Fe4S-binding SPASM domain